MQDQLVATPSLNPHPSQVALGMLLNVTVVLPRFHTFFNEVRPYPYP